MKPSGGFKISSYNEYRNGYDDDDYYEYSGSNYRDDDDYYEYSNPNYRSDDNLRSTSTPSNSNPSSQQVSQPQSGWTDSEMGRVNTYHHSNEEKEVSIFQATAGGQEVQVFKIENYRNNSTSTPEAAKFVLADGSTANGGQQFDASQIVAKQETDDGRLKFDAKEIGESYITVNYAGNNLVINYERESNGQLEFTIYQDGNADGLWTEIAEIETQASFFRDSNKLDLASLVGLIDYVGVNPDQAAI